MLKKFLILLFILWFTGIANGQTLVAGSYNIRFDNPHDSGNLWKDRAGVVAALIRFHDFDVLGTQEGLLHQLRDLKMSLPEYSYYGKGREDGLSSGEHSAIFYKKASFMVLDSGDFWLSENPEKPGWGWDARHNRICTWIRLRTKKGKKSFFVFNVHFDHQGIQARNESSRLVLEKIKTIAGKSPVILMGDFNGNEQSDWYKRIDTSGIVSNSLHLAKEPYINNGSFNGFQQNNHSRDLIDHIFISNHFMVKRFGLLTDTYHGKFPSDHFPLLVELEWKK